MRQCTWILALLSQEDPKTAGNAHNAYKITLNPSGFWNSQNSAGRKKKKKNKSSSALPVCFPVVDVLCQSLKIHFTVNPPNFYTKKHDLRKPSDTQRMENASRTSAVYVGGKASSSSVLRKDLVGAVERSMGTV